MRVAYRCGGRADGPAMLLLHALGESGADWEGVIPALAADYWLIAPDMRGHGASAWPGAYSFELMRDDAVELLDELGVERAIVVGHSMGAAVGWLLGLTRPERVSRLIIEDAPLPFPRETVVRTQPDGPLPFDWAAIVTVAAEVNDPTRRWWPLLPALKIPTLVVGGGAESSIPQEELARAASLVPDCHLVTIDAGHHVHRNRPEEFTTTVRDWLATRSTD